MFSKIISPYSLSCPKKVNRTLRLTLFMGFFLSPLNAKDFGVMGPTYSLSEENFLHHIKDKLKGMEASGQLKALQENLKKEMIQQVHNPREVRGVIKAKRTHSYTVKLSFTLKEDIVLPNGKTLHKKGVYDQPDSVGAPSFIFLDGTDKAQVTFALDYIKTKPSTLMLVKGQPFKLSEQHKVPFYFDQMGLYVARFKIKEHLSIVTPIKGGVHVQVKALEEEGDPS